MKTAILKNAVDLSKYADAVNAGRTDSTSFYVNDRKVSVSNTYSDLTQEQQIEELSWFLRNHPFTWECQCPDSDRLFVECGGDAESGPITVTQCGLCGKLFTHFGM